VARDADISDEFGLIATLFRPLAHGNPAARALSDDVAVLAPEPGYDSVITVDALVAGVHFLPDDPPALIAAKLLRVNLSDLAAKGAEPRAVLLAAAFPRDVTPAWLRAFAQGLGDDLARFGLDLIGGDTVATPGPLTLSLTALGRVPVGGVVGRDGARPGDDLWVSGSIGDGALGLGVARGGLERLGPDDRAFLLDRYRRPQPRLELGRQMRGLAGAAMDVSDGLVQDLGHLCGASGLGARLWAARVPLSGAARRAVESGDTTLASLLGGGDDYELLFSAPPAARPAIRLGAGRAGCPVTRIGRFHSGAGVRVIGPDGGVLAFDRGGWRHFGAQA
jgi:thiamine-monophosphate kinase